MCVCVCVCDMVTFSGVVIPAALFFSHFLFYLKWDFTHRQCIRFSPIFLACVFVLYLKSKAASFLIRSSWSFLSAVATSEAMREKKTVIRVHLAPIHCLSTSQTQTFCLFVFVGASASNVEKKWVSHFHFVINAVSTHGTNDWHDKNDGNCKREKTPENIQSNTHCEGFKLCLYV